MRPWDEAKDKLDQRDHGIGFDVALLAFDDAAHVYRVIDNIEGPWLIIARKAVKYEENVYYSYLKD
jgi:uncharacterized DUF497 family protein